MRIQLSWDPPLVGFVVVLAASLIGTSLAIGIFVLGDR
jgi:hypothetical protein